MKDYILHERGALPKEVCEDIINKFENDWVNYHEIGTIGIDSEVDLKRKHSTEIFWHLEHRKESFFDLKYLGKCIDKYKEFFPLLDEIVIPWGICPTIKIQRYKPNEGYFSTHCEYNGNRNDIHEKRMLVWMIYLNDVTDGGETEFPTQKIKFQPRAGDVLVWPAYWTHPHHGITSETQTKYIITGWYSFKY